MTAKCNENMSFTNDNNIDIATHPAPDRDYQSQLDSIMSNANGNEVLNIQNNPDKVYEAQYRNIAVVKTKKSAYSGNKDIRSTRPSCDQSKNQVFDTSSLAAFK